MLRTALTAAVFSRFALPPAAEGVRVSADASASS